MEIRDSAITPGVPRVESVTPVVDRLIAGSFDEGAGYATYRRRGTTDWLLMHTTAGEGRFGVPGGDLRLLPGQVVLIRPGTTHDYGVEPRLRRWQFRFVHFHPRSGWEALLAWPEAAPGVGWLAVAAGVERRVSGGLADVVAMTRSPRRRREFFAMNALESVLLWCDDQLGSSQRLDDRLQPVVDLIERDPAADLGVPRLAAAAAMSVSRFAHLFTAQIGVPPREFVERRRLEVAAQLLDLTSRSVAGVAAAVGFDDPLYFSTRFRRYYGVSPRHYRRRSVG